ncbi:UNVERIFIED_CONTAM: hypothetical protein FKN15_051047 [Acipenser sinensis]
MIVERFTEHSGDLECGLMTSPMNLGYFYGDSPASSDQSGSPQSHYSPCSPNSDSESSSSWSSTGCYANPDGATENGQSTRGGGKQQNKAFQGVRVKNPVKELLMNKRSNQVTQSPRQEHNQVTQNPRQEHNQITQPDNTEPSVGTQPDNTEPSAGTQPDNTEPSSGTQPELKTILREGKRHASESVFDAFSYKRAAPFRLLTPPQTPTSIENMDNGQRNEPRSSEANPNILNIIQMVNDSAAQVSLTTVQFNGGNPSQDHQRDQYYKSYGGQVSMKPQVSSPPQASDTAQMFPFYSPAQMQEFPYTSPCLASVQSPVYPATQPDILQFNIPSQVGNQEEQQNTMPSIFSSPAPRLDPQIFSAPQLPSKCPQIPQEPGGMSFFQWQIEQEDRKLANITQEHLISKDSDGDTFLHIAVAQGRRALSYVLARKMASFGMLDVKEHNGQSALQVAVAANQHLIVQDLLSLGAQINTADCWGRTPLHVCAEKGHAQTIQAIQKGVLENGQQLDLEAINYDGMTALHRAVVSHNAGVQELQKTLQPRSPHIQGLLIKNKRLVDCIKTLLQMGATIHAKELQKTLQPRSPHIQGLLIKNKRLVDCIKTLLQMGATIHAKDRKSGRTAVHIAAEEANLELLQLFLDQPDCLTIVNTKLYNGNTALHIAASLQNRVAQLDAVRLLMRKGADPSTRNLENEQPQNLVPDGPVGEQSALQVAVAANQHLIVQDLLSLGAQINTADCWGRTPLHVCAEKGHAQTIQAIQKGVLENGQQLDLEAINYDGMTALHRAVVSHNAGVQELQKTLQPRSPHIQGLLIKNKRLVDCIKTLLQMGATIHAKDRKSGRTAVHIAAEEANLELLQLFLDQPDCLTIVNTKLYNGNTALHIAASLQNRVAQLDAVRLLMRKGADPSTRNLENEQPQNLVPDGPVGEQVDWIFLFVPSH